MKGKNKLERREKSFNMLYVLPMAVVYVVLIIYPMLEVMRTSLYERKVNGDMLFVGLENFISFFENPDSAKIVLNTAIWVLGCTFAKLFLGFLMALILYKNFFGKKMITGVMLIPYAMPAAVSCMIWRLLYNPMFGHIGSLNVSVATAIMMYEVVRQRLAADMEVI